MKQFEDSGQAIKTKPPSEGMELLEALTTLEKLATEGNVLTFKMRDALFGATPSTIQEKQDPHTGGGLFTRIRTLLSAITETTIESNNELSALLDRCSH